jgi:hypothetical protein
MGMAVRRFAGGKLSLLGTFSLEPATIPPEGSPELFQRGETYNGILLVDLQHPHDFFTKLAVAWERTVARAQLGIFTGAGREPAPRPPPFTHRLRLGEPDCAFVAP